MSLITAGNAHLQIFKPACCTRDVVCGSDDDLQVVSAAAVDAMDRDSPAIELLQVDC